jgi:hypothetical protein
VVLQNAEKHRSIHGGFRREQHKPGSNQPAVGVQDYVVGFKSNRGRIEARNLNFAKAPFFVERRPSADLKLNAVISVHPN